MTYSRCLDTNSNSIRFSGCRSSSFSHSFSINCLFAYCCWQSDYVNSNRWRIGMAFSTEAENKEVDVWSFRIDSFSCDIITRLYDMNSTLSTLHFHYASIIEWPCKNVRSWWTEQLKRKKGRKQQSNDRLIRHLRYYIVCSSKVKSFGFLLLLCK